MQNPGTLKLDETVAAWADIVLKIWSSRIIEMKVYDSGDLLKSLKYELFRNAGNNPQRIEFSYAFYGIFQDFGSDVLARRRWWTTDYYPQLMRLKEILTDKYIDSIITNVAFHMQPNKFVK